MMEGGTPTGYNGGPRMPPGILPVYQRPLSWPPHLNGLSPPGFCPPVNSVSWCPPEPNLSVGQRLWQLEKNGGDRDDQVYLMEETLKATAHRVDMLENLWETNRKEPVALNADCPPAWALELQKAVGELRIEVSNLARGPIPGRAGGESQFGLGRQSEEPSVQNLPPDVAESAVGHGAAEEEEEAKSNKSRPASGSSSAPARARASEPDLVSRSLMTVMIAWTVMMGLPYLINVGAQAYQLKALQCEPEEGQAMVAFSLPVQCQAPNRDGVNEFVYSTESVRGTSFSTTAAFILQKTGDYELVGKKFSKRVSTDTHHCGMLSYESPETVDDRVYERVVMSPSECEEATRGIYTDSIGQLHHVAEQGVTYISFMSLGEISRKGETVSCRGETAVVGGRRLTGVVQRTHLEIEVTQVEARMDRRTKDIILPESRIKITSDRWDKKGFVQVADAMMWFPIHQQPPCPFEIAKGPLDFLEVPALRESENVTILLHAPSKLRLDMGNEEPLEEECASLMGSEDKVYRTNYQQLYLLRRGGKAQDQKPLQLLVTQVNEVQPELVAATQTDFVSYVLQNSLQALRGQVNEGGCLNDLAQTYALRHRQARGNMKVVIRNDLVYLLPCRNAEVTAVGQSAGGVCSDQLTVKDKDGELWQLSPVDRLLVKSVRQVPCVSTQAMGYAYKTLDGQYITQNPNLSVVQSPTDPTIKEQASRLWNQYRDAVLLKQSDNDTGPYSATILEEYEGAFLREWTVAASPVQITHDSESQPSVHANAARHNQFLAATGGGIGSIFGYLKGGLLTAVESGVITMIMHLGSLAGLFLVFERVCVSICNGARVVRARREEGEEDRRCQVGWAAVCCPLPLLMWALLAKSSSDEAEEEPMEERLELAPVGRASVRALSRRHSDGLSGLYQQAAATMRRRED